MTQDLQLNFTAPYSGTAHFGGGGGWNKAFLALLSLNAGETRPSYAQAGTLWMKNTTTPWELMLFDGSEDILIFKFDPTTHTLIHPPLPAHSLLMNATASAAAPASVTLGASTILARGASGNSEGKSISAILDFLTSTADKMAYRGAGGWTHSTLTAFARGLLEKTSASEMVSYLGASNNYKGINGLTISNNATDATNDLNIAAGDCLSSDRTAWMNLATGLTKQTDAAFAEGTNQGGMLNGDPRPTDGFLYAWAISKDDGTVDIGFTDEDTTGLGLTVGDLPIGFTKLRYIGSWAVASSALVAMYQEGDIVRYNARVLDYNATTGIPTTPTSIPISVPSVLCEVELASVLSNSSNRWVKILDSMSAETGTPSPTDCDLAVGTSGVNSIVQFTRLSEAASIKLHSSSSTASVMNIQTRGWRDIRRGQFS